MFPVDVNISAKREDAVVRLGEVHADRWMLFEVLLIL
jgi:hypothetical protein